MKISVYKYLDYRKFLQDFYQDKKSRDGYTFQDFARAAGMNSPSWLGQLIHGKKNLTNESTLKVIRALKLKKAEAEYFEMLVPFTQSASSELKNHFYSKMMSLKKRLKLITMGEEQHKIFTQWYHPVVRSLVSKVKFGNDYAKLGKKLLPAITAKEAEASVKMLEKLGFIKKTKGGKWVQSNPVETTGDEVSSLNVMNYHRQMSKLAAGAYERSPKEMRNISSLTLGINKKDYEKFKAKIQAFHRQMVEMGKESKRADSVFQLNVQLFPVSDVGGDSP